MRNAGNRKFIRVMQTLISVKELTGEPDERKRSRPVRGGGAGKVPLKTATRLQPTPRRLEIGSVPEHLDRLGNRF